MEALPERPALAVDPTLKAKKAAKDQIWDEAESGGRSFETAEDLQKVIKIASGADFLLALKANGEVWACSVRDPAISAWIYVSLNQAALLVTRC